MVDEYQKYIFVHIPRTGGTFAMNHLFNNGFQIYCPWSNDLMRDWTRSELYDLINQDGEFSKAALHKYSNQIHPDLQRKDRVIHSHLIAFDHDLVHYAKRFGWKIVMTIREPVSQLCSIFAKFYFNSGIGVNEFIDGASKLPELNRWFIPYWWQVCDSIIDITSGGVLSKLNFVFNCKNNGFGWRYMDETNNSIWRAISRELTQDTIERVRASFMQQRYFQCSQKGV